MSNIGFLFPGQGAQFVGMGRDLVDQLPACRGLYDRAAQVLGYDLAEICFEGPVERLNATEYSQPALFVSSMAALEKLRADEPTAFQDCTLTAGLSLGEYSALCFADVLSFEDALQVVQRRGRAMQEAADAHPGSMVAVLGLEPQQIEDLCDQTRAGQILQIANLLCPGNVVCSGDSAACDRLAELADAAGAMKVIPLAVAGAFHTPLMKSAVEKLAAALGSVAMAAPRIPIVSNVDAEPHSDAAEIRELLIQQIVSPVRWEASVRTMMKHGTEAFYEIGAGKVLRGLMKRIDRKVPVTNV